MYYHASPVKGINILEPRISNHGTPRVYLADKRENTLVYLSNAVEKYCRETGFAHNGPWPKWGSYGFQNGLLCLEEYYPNALDDTYKGVPGYIYSAETVPGLQPLADIPGAIYTAEPVPVSECEYVPDALEAITAAAEQGLIIIRRYEELSESMLQWIERSIKQEYEAEDSSPTYRHFLMGKFPEIIARLG